MSGTLRAGFWWSTTILIRSGYLPACYPRVDFVSPQQMASKPRYVPQLNPHSM